MSSELEQSSGHQSSQPRQRLEVMPERPPDKRTIHAPSMKPHEPPPIVPLSRRKLASAPESLPTDPGSSTASTQPSLTPSLAASSYKASETDDSSFVNHRDISCKIPAGWQRNVHLDGSLYFYHTGLKILTNEEIWVSTKFETLQAEIDKTPIKATGDLELSFRPDPKGGYTFHVVDIVGMVAWRYNPSNNMVEGLECTIYWQHLIDYPMYRRRLPALAESFFVASLAYGANERVLGNKDTIFPFTDSQTQRLVSIFSDLTSFDADPGEPRHLINATISWHIARVMFQIQKSRIEYKYGTPEARIYRNVSIPKPTRTITVIDYCLAFVLFGAHRMYRRRLQSTRVKGVIYLPDFRELVQSLLVEWADSNLLATVFVSANVAFLAIPNITGIQQTASLISTLFSLSSIAIGVHHVWQHRSKVNASEEDAAQYLSHMRRFMLGNPKVKLPTGAVKSDELLADSNLTIIACFLSLPIVLLLWSVLSFTVAVGAFCIEANIRNSSPKIFLSVALGVLGMVAIGTLAFFWRIWQEGRMEEIGMEEFHKREGQIRRAVRAVSMLRNRVWEGTLPMFSDLRGLLTRRSTGEKTGDVELSATPPPDSQAENHT